MFIDSKPEQQRVIEIIREQLDLEGWMSEEREAIAGQIERGFAQAERGELIDGDSAIATLQSNAAPPG